LDNTRWANYLRHHLARLEWTNADLADAAGLDRSLVGRWINGEAQPTVTSVRKVCKAIRRDIREGLEESGLLTRAELRRTGDTGKLELNMFNDDELLDEMRRRLIRRPGAPVTPASSSTFSEASGGVSADWAEQNGDAANGSTGRQPHFSAG
jgi:transcriptional regulator with XRE-family HTH domain